MKTEYDIVNEKNIRALHEAVKQNQQRIDDLTNKLNDSLRANVQLQQDINTLRAQLAAMLNMR